MANLEYSYTQDQVRQIAENATTLTQLERALLELVDSLCDDSSSPFLSVRTLLERK